MIEPVAVHKEKTNGPANSKICHSREPKNFQCEGRRSKDRLQISCYQTLEHKTIKKANRRSCEHTTNLQEKQPSLTQTRIVKIHRRTNEIEKCNGESGSLGRFAFSLFWSVPIEVCSSAELRGGPELLAAKQLLRTPLAICCLPVKSYMQIYIAFFS